VRFCARAPPAAARPPNPGAPSQTTPRARADGGKVNYAYSVGNEPDLWPDKVTATQLAHDAVAMKGVLKGFNIGTAVYGSSWARISPQNAQDFLPIAAAGGVEGLTVHNYPYGGHDCVVQNYLNKSKVTANLRASLRAVADVKAAIPAAAGILLVLEETAGSSGGGCENVTDRFVASFVWMNTLNAVGAAGFQRVHRQDIAGWSLAFGRASLFCPHPPPPPLFLSATLSRPPPHPPSPCPVTVESHYMLLGPAGWTNGTHDTLTPHPDYYLTILWRQLMGRQILSTTASGPGAQLEAVEAHAWCAAARAPYGAGAAVLAWTNQGASDVPLQLPALFSAGKATLFTLTATPRGTGEGDLQSDDVFLNGARMTVDAGGNLPAFPIAGKEVPAGTPMVARAFSLGFIAFEAPVAACA
jgi:hypothetical protein